MLPLMNLLVDCFGLIQAQLRQRAAHMHFFGAAGELNEQAAIRLGGAAPDVSIVSGDELQVRESPARSGMGPDHVIYAGYAFQVGKSLHFQAPRAERAGGVEARQQIETRAAGLQGSVSI